MPPTKTCRGPCGKELPLEEFSPGGKRSIDGRDVRCRKCNAVRAQEFRSRTEHLVKSGNPRRCHRCRKELPRKGNARYLGSRPFCPGCVGLCRTANCNWPRSTIYKGTCQECGIKRQRERMGKKECRKCGAVLIRGASRVRLCRACIVPESIFTQRKTERARLRPKYCPLCGQQKGSNKKLCLSCTKERSIVRNRFGAKRQKAIRRAKRHEIVATFTLEAWKELLKYFGNRCAYCARSRTLEQEHMIPLVRGGDHTEENIVPACRSCNAHKMKATPLEFLIRNGGIN